MGPARIVVLIIALIAAIGAVFMMRALMGGSQADSVVAEAVQQEPRAGVLTAARDLVPGERLTAADLAWTEWPQSAASPAFVLQTAQPDAMDTYSEAIVRSPIAMGEPILATKLVMAGDAGFMAAMLSPGMRAVSIPITAESAAGGFILPPDDRVDVLLTREFIDPEGETSQTEYVTETILRNVRVLAIDQTPRLDDGVATILGSTATLELTPSEAEVLNQGMAAGTLSLSLLSVADAVQDTAADRVVIQAENPVQSSVTVLRYGVIGHVAVQDTPERAQ